MQKKVQKYSKYKKMSLNRSLPNVKLKEGKQLKEERYPNSALNRSLDLRRYLSVKSKESPESSRKPKEKSQSRKVYLLKRKHDDGNESPKVKRSRSNYVSKAAPMYRHYQLLGDSQFVRFSEQLLSYKDCVSFIEGTRSRRIGYCVSGQKIKDLKERIESEEFAIYPYVIILIGTNDILCSTDLQEMCKNYNRLLEILKQKCRKLILLTVPPIARFENKNTHWFILRSFNEFIQKAADGSQVFTLDLCSLFISYNNTISKDYYESYFFDSRPDLLHLNRKGFLLLRSMLDIYFDSNEENMD